MKTLLLIGAMAAPVVAVAQSAESTELEPVVVTTTRSAQAINRLPAAVTVITREEIERSGARHVVDVLRGSGVAQITDFFGDGSRAQVDLRGFGEGAPSNSLILVDGRRLNNTDIAAPDLNSISLKDVERIEILQGSAGALYGDQAVGGVINIITRPVRASSTELAVSGGSFEDAYGTRVQLARSVGDVAFRLSAEGRRSDNYRDHNRLEYQNAFAYGEYALGSSSRVFAEAGYVDEDLQTPGALFADEVAQDRRQSTVNFRNDFSATRTASARIGTALALGADWELAAEATHRRSDGTFRLSSAAFGAETRDASQDREIHALNPRLSGRLPLPGGDALLTLGADLQKARYMLDSRFGVQRNEQTQRDAYFQIILPLAGTLEATLGARAGRVQNEVLDGFTFVTPTRFHDSQKAAQIGLSLEPLPGLRLYTRYDGNFRYAKVDEFTNAGAPAASNRNPLQTQTGDGYELGGDWQAGPWQAQLSAYRLDLREEIAFDPNSFTNFNLPVTRRDGQGLSLRWQALDALRLSLAYQHVDAQVRHGDFAGKAVPLVAQNTGLLAAELALPRQLSARLEWLGTDDRAFAGDFDNSLSRLPGYGVVNAALGGSRGAWQWRARLNNLLDREYSEYGASSFDGSFNEAESFFPSPGINGALELRYRF